MMLSTSLSDTLSSSVPKLDSSGLNWPAFSIRFQSAVDAKGFWGHFDGSNPRPFKQVPMTTGATTTMTTAAVQPPLIYGTDITMAEWDSHEKVSRSLLYQKITDSTLMVVGHLSTVQEIWTAIVKDYTQKWMFAQNELRAKFLESRCPGRGNVKEFLDNLRAKREELASMGVSISDDDYRSTIITSLPFSWSSFAASTLASIRMMDATFVVPPDILISSICEEYARQAVERARNPRFQSKQSGKQKEEVPSVDHGSGKPSKKNKPREKCSNCGDEGHWKKSCHKPKKKWDGSNGGGESSKCVGASVVSDS